MRKLSRLLILLLLCSSVQMLSARSIAELEDLLRDGDAATAFDDAVGALEAKPKASQLAQLSLIAGKAAYQLGEYGVALEYLTVAKNRGLNEASLWIARIDMRNYDFDKAVAEYSKYIAATKKSGKSLPLAIDTEMQEATDAAAYALRVESIAIIDSITVPVTDYYRNYRLPSSAGALISPKDLPKGLQLPKSTLYPLYANENGDMLLFSAPFTHQTITEEGDTIQNLKMTLWQADLLTDGSWDINAHPELRPGHDVFTPFMLSDGQTLYYSTSGEGTIGGLDIMVSSRDAASGAYRAGQNLGMPYNSPWDDCMYVIDEENNVGWWATKRNAQSGSDNMTIYLFIPNEMRINREGTAEELKSFARIDDIHATWTDDSDYAPLVAEVRNIKPVIKKTDEFCFPISGRGVLHNWSDLRSREGKEALRRYLALKKKYDALHANLAQLRKQYAGGYKGAAAQIRELEANEESSLRELRKAANEVYRYEAEY